MDWKSYHSYKTMMSFLDEVKHNNKDGLIDLKDIGKTAEGRLLKMIKFGHGKSHVFIDAGIHAREWIAPAVGLYIVKKLEEHHPAYLRDNLTIHIIPLMNPDGYEFSRTDDRLWRKNRSPLNFSDCVGVDLNRNFGFQFGVGDSSSDPCASTFKGLGPFSEYETMAARDYFKAIDGAIILAISIHCCLSKWLYPWGFDKKALIENTDEIHSLCNEAVIALNHVNKQNFTCIQSAKEGAFGGASDDWYASQGVRFAYTPELRVAEKPFEIPEDQIQPSAEEMWEAVHKIMGRVATF